MSSFHCLNVKIVGAVGMVWRTLRSVGSEQARGGGVRSAD